MSLKIELSPNCKILAFLDYHNSDAGLEVIVFQIQYCPPKGEFFHRLPWGNKSVDLQKHEFEYTDLSINGAFWNSRASKIPMQRTKPVNLKPSSLSERESFKSRP